MATLQSPPAPSVRRRTAPIGPKLRDSCNGCAAAKLRCSKEKPTCARCLKRGLVCEYFETKRAGRKQGSRSSMAKTPPMVNDVPMMTSAWTTTASDPEVLTSPGVSQSSQGQAPVNYPEIFSRTPSLVDPATSTPNTVDLHFDDFPAPPIPHSMLDGSHAGPVPDPCEFHGDHNLGYPMEHSKEAPIFCSSISSMEPATVPGFRPSSPPSHTFSSYPQSITTELNSAPTYGFLNQTLGLLKQFPSAATLTSPSSRGEAFENYQGIGQEQTLQSVMADNEQTLQSISDILQCQNSEDEYLRAMLTIIIFKVLNSYAAVLRCTPRFDGGPHWNKNHVDRTPAGVAGGYDAHGKDHGRMVAQQILHEVHRIQQLVNVLTERFSPHRGRVEPLVSSSSSSSTDRPDMFWDRERLSPLPGSLLEQIEIDLRRRLRNLLAEIVDILH